MDRETIIADVARTLFVCAWADGVESGELEGEGPGPGGDWMDAAPRTFALAEPALGWAQSGASEGATLSHLMVDRQGIARPHCGSSVPCGGEVRREGPPAYAPHKCARCAKAEREYTREVPDPDALAEARRIVDAFDAAQLAGPRPDGVPHIVDASEVYESLTDSGRFAHEFAMTALGHGVTFDVYPRELPGWIRASVPSSGFGYFDLDPERYPAPARTADEDAEGGAA